MGYRNSLGLSLRAKGRSTGQAELLRAADATFRAAIDAAPDATDVTAPMLNLAAVLQDRAEAENDAALLREAVDIYRKVLPHLGTARQARATTNAATAMVDLYRYTLHRQFLTDAIQDLRASAATLPDEHTRRVALANLGAALHEMYDSTGQISVLDQAIIVQQQLLDRPGEWLPERLLNLGVSLLARFRRRRATSDLDQAITLFEEVYRSAASPIERASALNSQANGLSLRHDLTGSLADVDQSISLREQAIAVALSGSIDLALYRANLGVDLLKRFELSGAGADLDRAIDEQRRALRDAPAGSADGPRLLAGLADSLARRSDLGSDGEDAAETHATYRRVVEQGVDVLPEQALAAALRWGGWAAKLEQWSEAATTYRFGLAALTRQIARQEQRSDKESWLGDAAGLPASAAVAHTRVGDLAGAVTMLDSGRAMLLTDALRRRPVVTHPPE